MEPLHSRRYAKRQYKFSASERSRRLAKIVPYAVFDDGQCWGIKCKDPSIAYSDVVPTDEFMGHATCNAILGDDDKTVAFITRSYLTMHTFGHPGSFRPTMCEVVDQLPVALFNDCRDGSMYVTTELFGPSPEQSITPCGFHMGITTVAIRRQDANKLVHFP
jgi:hypothetical protein